MPSPTEPIGSLPRPVLSDGEQRASSLATHRLSDTPAGTGLAGRRSIGIRTCPRGDCDSRHNADVDYAELLPSMFKTNAGHFLMQLSSEHDKERIHRLVGEHGRADARRAPQVCFIGVVNPLDPRVDTAEEACGALIPFRR